MDRPPNARTRLRVPALLVALTVVFAAVAGPALAGEGDLDPAFNGGQPVIIPAGINAVAKQADGKIVIVGSTGTNGTWAIERYQANGQIDMGFGSAGVVEMTLGGQATGVAIQPSDQRIVVGGTAKPGSTYGAEFVRLNTDGSPDQSYGTGGAVFVSSMSLSFLTGGSLTLDSSGNAYLGGSGTDAGFNSVGLIASATSAGAPNSWGTNGIIVANTGGSGIGPRVVGLAVAGSSLFYAGSVFDGSFNSHALIGAVKLADGSPVTDFGTNGLVQLGQATGFSALLLAGDGKLKAAGFAVGGGPGTGALIASFNTSGTDPTDTSFGSGGRVVVGGAAGEPNNANALTEEGGELFAATTAVLADSSTQIALVGVDKSTGAPDTGLGSGGFKLYGFGVQSFATGIADEPSGGVEITGAVQQTQGGDEQGLLAVAQTGTGGTTEQSHPAAHYHIELKAWIPFARVVDPLRPLRVWWGAAVNFGDCFSPGVFNREFRTNVLSLYNGNDHIPYDGSYKAIAAADFDWDGKAISNFTATTDFGETLRYLQYTVQNIVTQNSRIVECIVQRAHATVAASATQVGPTGFKLNYSTAQPIVVASPTIDGTLFGTLAPDGTISLSYDSDLFPSHGFRVIKNGTIQVTQTISDASCIGNALGVRGTTLIAWGLTHLDNHGTFTVHPGDAGLTGSTPSLLCSTTYWMSIVSDEASKAYKSFIDVESGKGSRAARAAARKLAVQIGVRGSGGKTQFMSLAAAAGKGIVATQPLPTGIAILSTTGAPVTIKATGVRPEVTTSQIVRGAQKRPTTYIGNRTLTAALASRANVTGKHIRRITKTVGPPSTRAHVVKKGKLAIVTFKARSPVGVVGTFVIVAGKPVKVHGGAVRVPLAKLGKLLFASVDELGQVEKPHTV